MGIGDWGLGIGDWGLGCVSAITASSTPGTGLYFYFIGKIGNDKLLPCISAFISFSMCFSLIHNQIDDKRVKRAYIATSLFLFMSRGLLMQIISNIRTIMALAICGWCVYQEFYNHAKWKRIVLPYVLAASLHVMGQAMLVYRLAYLLIEKGKNPTQKIIRTVAAVIAGLLVWIFGNRYIFQFVAKADGYVSNARQNEGYSYFWEGLLCAFVLIVLIYMVTSFRKVKERIEKNNLDDNRISETIRLINYMIPLIVLDVLSGFIEFNIFLRVNWFLTILMLPLCIQLLKYEDFIDGRKSLCNNIRIAAFVMLAVACVRGDLCSLKFFIIQ